MTDSHADRAAQPAPKEDPRRLGKTEPRSSLASGFEHSYRIVHDLGCDFENVIVGHETPATVVNALGTAPDRMAFCGCGANPALIKPRIEPQDLKA